MQQKLDWNQFYVSIESLSRVENCRAIIQAKAFLWLSSLASIIGRLYFCWNLETLSSSSPRVVAIVELFGGDFSSSF